MKESYRSIRWEWVGFGWFIAAAVTSFFLLVFSVLGLVEEGAAGEAIWMAVALALGFFLVGFWVGTRVVAAPIFHAAGFGLISVVFWALANLLFGAPLGDTTWNALRLPDVGTFLILQVVAAAVGARIGVRRMRRVPETL